jgi:hypothetical protein
VREHASHDRQPEPKRVADRPDVPQGELDATVVARRTQPLVSIDAGERPIQQCRRAIDADDLPSPSPQQLREQPTRPAAKVDRRSMGPPRPLAIEREVLGDRIVLQVVELGEQRLVAAVAGKDVAQP